MKVPVPGYPGIEKLDNGPIKFTVSLWSEIPYVCRVFFCILNNNIKLRSGYPAF